MNTDALRDALAEWDRWTNPSKDGGYGAPFNVVLTHRAEAMERLVESVREVVSSTQADAARLPEFEIGQLVRYGYGSTAIMRIESVSGARYYGTQCMGGTVGRNRSELSPASSEDLKVWEACVGWRGK